MSLITADHAREFSLHGVTFTSFVASGTGARTLAAWRADFAPRTPGQPHSMSQEEVLYVLDGCLSVQVDEASFRAVAGEAVLVQAGSVLTVSNDSDEPARAWVCTRSGMRARMSGSGEEIAPPWAQ